MLDYEIIDYKVEYRRKGAISSAVQSFKTEEDAVEFLKSEYGKFEEYRLLKIQAAVLNFDKF